jgi:uncharacterized protein (TIGR03118 family)
MHVQEKRNSRFRVLAVCVGLLAVCAQASSFWSCSWNTQGSLPIVTPPVAPSLAINVAPTTIVLGQGAVLSWSSTSATSCTASGAWSGPQPPQGTTTVKPATSGTFAYILNCATFSGSIAQSATLTVNPMAVVSKARSAAPVRHAARLVRTDLVADVGGTTALSADPNLTDPWGLVLAEKLPAVVTSRKSSSATSYDGTGNAQPAARPLLVNLPATTGGAAFGAAGVVSNSSDGFVVSAGGRSASARLVYAGTSGRIAAWSPEVDVGSAIVTYATDDAAVYTALAIATSSSPGESRLYAADFRNGRVDVFDTAFRKEARSPTKFAFADPALPAGYAPFGIAVIDELVYVAYAQRASDRYPVSGPGLGLIAVFTVSGDFITRLVTSGGALNAPWSMVRAPAEAAALFRGALLVGNTGDGRINAFDAATGALMGSVTDATGAALVVPNLHGLALGNQYAEQPATTLFFTAGAHDGARGWYGRLDFGPPFSAASPRRPAATAR